MKPSTRKWRGTKATDFQARLHENDVNLDTLQSLSFQGICYDWRIQQAKLLQNLERYRQ